MLEMDSGHCVDRAGLSDQEGGLCPVWLLSPAGLCSGPNWGQGHLGSSLHQLGVT